MRSYSISVAILFFALTSSPQTTPAKHPFTAKDWAALHSAGVTAVSPNGDILYQVSHGGEKAPPIRNGGLSPPTARTLRSSISPKASCPWALLATATASTARGKSTVKASSPSFPSATTKPPPFPPPSFSSRAASIPPPSPQGNHSPSSPTASARPARRCPPCSGARSVQPLYRQRRRNRGVVVPRPSETSPADSRWSY